MSFDREAVTPVGVDNVERLLRSHLERLQSGEFEFTGAVIYHEVVDISEDDAKWEHIEPTGMRRVEIFYTYPKHVKAFAEKTKPGQ